MPLTRSQTKSQNPRRTTRSGGQQPTTHASTNSSTIARQSGAKRGQTSAKRRKSAAVSPSSSTSSVQHDDKEKMRGILWDLMEEWLPPFTRIILKPFKETNKTGVSIAVVIFIAIYAVYNLPEEFGGGFWRGWFTPGLAGIIELPSPPRHRWVWRKHEVVNITTRIAGLAKENDGRQVHMYLVGGPGSGKSELARQVGLSLYDSLKRSKQPVDVMRIEAGSITALTSSLTDAVLALCKTSGQRATGIKEMNDELNFRRIGDSAFSDRDSLKTDMKLKILFSKLLELFETRNSRPVLIFDNVRDLKLLLNHLNLEPGTKHHATLTVIITIQKRVSLDRLSEYAQVKDLYEGMLSEDSIELLGLLTGIDAQKDDATELSRMLGRQPLALATAGIYIESVREGPPRKSGYSYQDYMVEFKRDIHMLGMEEEIEWQEGDASKYTNAMYVAVVKAVNLSAQADPVMRDISCAVGLTDTSPLSLEYVLGYLRNNSHHEFTEAQIRTSLRNVLFKVGGRQDEQTLESHQVMREAFRRVCKVSEGNPHCLNSTVCTLSKLSGNQKQSVLRKSLERIAFSFERQLSMMVLNARNTTNAATKTNGNFGSQFLDALTSLCVFSAREDVQVATIVSRGFSGMFLRFLSHRLGFWPGLIKAAENEFRLKDLVMLANLQPDAEDVRFDLQVILLVLCLNKGAARMQTGELMSAINKTSEGLGSLRKIPEEARASDVSGLEPVLLNILGVMYRSLGYPHNSRDLHKFALDFYLSSKRSEDNDGIEQTLELASTLHKLGIIDRYLGNLSSAKVWHEKSLDLLVGELGTEHHYIAGSLLNLAVVYSRQGNLKNALELYNRSLLISQAAYGPSHANTGRVLTTIGTAFYKMGEFEKAIEFTERGLVILEDFHGANHPHVAEALNFLGFMYRDQGNLERARDLLERSVRVKENVFHAGHFILGEAMNDLGVVYTRLGEARNARKILERALSIFKQTWGDLHSAVATTINSLGAAHRALKEPHMAVALHQKALDTFLNLSKGADSHSVAETRHLLGEAYEAMSRREDALVMYRLAYAGFSKLYESEHWRVRGALGRLKALESTVNGAVNVRAYAAVGLVSLVALIWIWSGLWTPQLFAHVTHKPPWQFLRGGDGEAGWTPIWRWERSRLGQMNSTSSSFVRRPWGPKILVSFNGTS